ncbi:hypothetical protein RCL_jg29438.t1 [Rhizophagus clarus]|uniref:Uncharacterized protein n=1 Tax=Rhizophagus clarus TaxID=94130 RepID=A0A8H3L2Y8_9GLOM|nr:hypothetical protein RCL_jg29438.t1 [Rhizophagus clarus]
MSCCCCCIIGIIDACTDACKEETYSGFPEYIYGNDRFEFDRDNYNLYIKAPQINRIRRQKLPRYNQQGSDPFECLREAREGILSENEIRKINAFFNCFYLILIRRDENYINENDIGNNNIAIAVIIIIYTFINTENCRLIDKFNDFTTNTATYQNHYGNNDYIINCNDLNDLREKVNCCLAVLSNNCIGTFDQVREETVVNRNNRNNQNNCQIGKLLYYGILNRKKSTFETMKITEPTYAKSLFTMRFADKYGIEVYPLEKYSFSTCSKKYAGAYDIRVVGTKIYLPKLDIQYYCRKINFLSLAFEHTIFNDFKNSDQILSLLTIYGALIENGEDVELLKMSGVLVHDFTSNEDCANFINYVTHNVGHHLPQKIAKDLDKLNKKAMSPCYKGELYFKNRWGVNWYTSLVLIIFVLGWIIQTSTPLIQLYPSIKNIFVWIVNISAIICLITIASLVCQQVFSSCNVLRKKTS